MLCPHRARITCKALFGAIGDAIINPMASTGLDVVPGRERHRIDGTC